MCPEDCAVLFCYTLYIRESRRIVLATPFITRSKHRCENNIRMDLEEIGINVGNWVYSAQDRDYWRALVNVALNLRLP